MSCLLPKPPPMYGLITRTCPHGIPSASPHDPPAYMRKQGRCHDYDPSLFHIGVTDRILNMAVLDSGRLIPSFYFCKSRFFYSLLIIPRSV